jgi:hypothetical protein
MGLMITATNAAGAGPGLWTFEMPPHQVRLFGTAPTSIGHRSVIVVKACNFDAKAQTLQFDVDDAVALNVGTQPEAIAIAAETSTSRGQAAITPRNSTPESTYAPGDRQFLSLVKDLLPLPMQRAAAALLDGVRQRAQGELKRGLSRNFSETPDNFWYVIIQPRVAQLSITIRGPVEHFENMAKLPIKDDRGNTLFKVTSEADVPSALELIFHAKRRK